MSEAASTEPVAAPPPEDTDFEPKVRAISLHRSSHAPRHCSRHSPRCSSQQVIDDEDSLAKEEALPQGDTEKEINDLEEEANLPIEEVIRRMKARAEAEGDEEEEEGEEEDDFDDEDEDSDEDEGEEDEDEEDEEEEEDEEGEAEPSKKKQKK